MNPRPLLLALLALASAGCSQRWESRYLTANVSGPASFELICSYSRGFERFGQSFIEVDQTWPAARCEGAEILPWVRDAIARCPTTADQVNYSCPAADPLIEGIWQEQGQKKAPLTGGGS